MEKNFLKLCICFVLLLSEVSYVSAQQRSVAPLPPMGWNSWNCMHGNIDEEKIKGIADAMVKSGMKDAGYQYVVIDDGWQKGTVSGGWNDLPATPGRDENGRLVADPVRFPSGIKALSDYIHSLGLKFGIYTSPGESTCTCRSASGGYEEPDIKTFVEWGVDYIKLDWCGCKGDYKEVLEKWHRLLSECGRPIVLSVNIGRGDDYSIQERTANMYRTTTDISYVWDYPPEEYHTIASIVNIIDLQEGLGKYHGPGHWCDPDMLQVGNGKLSYEENKSHFSLWAILAAPLIAGNDLQTMSDDVRNILTNREIIAIDQDPSGIMGTKVSEPAPGQEIYVKRLYKIDEQAVALLNRNDHESEITVKWDEIGIKGKAFVRDLWEHKDRGLYEDEYTAKVPAHGTVVLKIMANQYLSSLPETCGITKSEIAGNGLILECEGRQCVITGGNFASDIKGYSGTGYLVGKDHRWACLHATWLVNLEQGGYYNLTFRCFNKEDRDVSCRCNKTEDPILLKKGKKWQEVTVKIYLKEGINLIELSSPDKKSNDIAFDFLKIENI